MNNDINLESIDRYFATRRTVRSYTDREVPDALLTRLIDEASHAPNTGNMQLYSVIVSRNAADKAALAPLHFNQPSVTSCSVLLTFCADLRRFGLWCRESRAEAGFDNLQMLLAAIIDCALFAQQFNTLAEMHSIGCCYLGTTAYNAPQIAATLGLPDGVIPVISLTAGYPDGDAPLSPRLPVDAIIHQQHYHDYTADDIRRIYAALEARPDSRRFVAENGKETLAQVFTDIRYPRDANETFSTSLVDYLARYLRRF